jgi:SEC-C motif-containing protein
MRSRYTAYSLGRVGHLMSTVHPESPHHRADREAWAADLRQWCETARFLGLQVESSASEGPVGRVRYYARVQVGDRDASFGEDSRFLLLGGRWVWLDGTPWRPS